MQNVSGCAHEVVMAYLSYHQASELIWSDSPIRTQDLRSSMGNSDLEVRTSETAQCHIVYPNARPDIPIMICHNVDGWMGGGLLIRFTDEIDTAQTH